MNTKIPTDFLWKIVLTGDSFVGKTTIRKRAMGEHFAEEYISTVGADFSSYKLKLGDLSIGFQVWDLAGQDKYKYIRSSFYGGATGCFLVFDVTNPKSLNSLSNWVDEAIRYSNGTIEIFIICANKIDLKNQREISRETGEKYAKALRESSGLQCTYIETSALTGENIDIAFDAMAKCLLEREGITPVKAKEELVSLPEKESIPTDSSENSEEPLTSTRIIKDSTIEAAREIIKSNLVADDDIEETDKLIAEVMNVLDETNDVIIGREITAEGERAITVPKNSFKGKIVEEEPKITPELERVLKSINLKLDSMTHRLKDLEEEIANVKVNGIASKSEQEEIDEVKEAISDLREDLEVIESEQTEIDEEELEESVITDIDTVEVELIEESEEIETDILELEEDEKMLESILTFESESKPEEEIKETEDSETISVQKENEEDILNELLDLPEDELVDIPDEEEIETIEESSEKSDSIIGTELSSAMISELKDMSDDEEETEHDEFLTQPLKLMDEEEKKKCPICGEPTKFIRQHNRHYCVKCGRYLI